MRLTVVGCSGTYPGPESPCSSYLVEHDGFRLVLDLGNGSVGALARYVDVLAIDAVHLSHLHGDHCLDLVPFAYALRYPRPGDQPAKLPVYGPRGTQERLENAFDVPRPGYLDDVYDVREVSVGRRAIGPFAATLARTNHPVECHAIRLDADGQSLVFSGDSGASADLTDLARGVDLLLCEATYADGVEHPPDIHLTPRQAGEHAAAAGAGRLVLTHLLPWADPGAAQASASAVFGGPVEIARPGAEYPL
ncbi:MAG: MBL fold metallo-hydrolase [Actinomycetes bacterium]